MNDSPFHDRLATSLQRAATDIPLRRSTVVEAVRAGRRRQFRHRRVVAVASVVGIGGTTTVAVQVLARANEPSIRTDISDDSTNTSQPAADTIPPSASGMIGARLVESNLQWNVIHPDTAAAVNGGYDAYATSFPGLAVSTAPGRSESSAYQLWRSDDGVTFTAAGEPPASVRPGNLVGDGAHTYLVGTAPGSIANRVTASVTSDGGTSWNTAELPIDTSSLDGVPHLQGLSPVVQTVVPVPGGALTHVVRTIAIDPHGLDLPEGAWDMTADHFTVADTECLDDASRDDDEHLATDATSAATTSILFPTGSNAATELEHPECYTIRAWSDFGVTEETTRHIGRTDWFFLVGPDGTATEIAPPPEDLTGLGMPRGGLPIVSGDTTDGHQRLYRLHDDLTWHALPALDRWTTSIVEIDAALFAFGASPDGGQSIARLDGDRWTQIDGDPLAEDGHALEFGQMTSNAAGLTAIAYQHAPAPSDATINTTPTSASPETADSTTTTTTTTPHMVYPSTGRLTVVNSRDGIAWSRESIADIAGVDERTISNITRLSTAGPSVVIAVTVGDSSDGEVPAQIVLVGTPRR